MTNLGLNATPTYDLRVSVGQKSERARVLRSHKAKSKVLARPGSNPEL